MSYLAGIPNPRANFLAHVKKPSIDALSPLPIINGAIRTPIGRYKGGDANGTNWVPWVYGETLDQEGTTPTFNTGSPLLKVTDNSWQGNGSAYYEADNTSFGDLGTDDLFFEHFFCYGGGSGSRFSLSKVNAPSNSEGWRIFTNNDYMYCSVEDSSANYALFLSSTSLKIGHWYYVAGFINRNEASTYGSQMYIQGLPDGTGVDCSAVGDVDAAIEMRFGKRTDDTGGQTLDKMAYLAWWQGEDMIQAGLSGKTEIDALVAERFAKLTGMYSMGVGTELAIVATRASSSYVDKLEYSLLDDPLQDGDMSESPIDAWTAQGSTALAKETDSPYAGSLWLKVTRLSGDFSCYQSILEDAKEYRVTGVANGDGTSNPRVLSTATFFTGTSSTSWQNFDFVRSSGNGTAIWFVGTNPVADGNFVGFDSVTVCESLLADGDMETSGTGDYSSGNSATLSKETGTPYAGTQCLRVAYNSVDYPYAEKTILSAGTTYRIRGVARGDGTQYPRVATGTTVLWTGTTSTSWQEFDLVHNTDDGRLRLFGGQVGAGYSEFDAITVVASVLADGDMEDSGTTDWTTVSATLSKQTGTPYAGTQCLRVAQTSSAEGVARQSVLSIGTIYRIKGHARSDGTTIPRIRSSATLFWTGTTSTSWQEFDFLLNADMAVFDLCSSGGIATNYVEFDVISVEGSLLVDGDMEDNGCDEWVSGGGTTVLVKDSVDPYAGDFWMKVIKGGGQCEAYQNKLVAGNWYRIRGAAQCDGTAVPQIGGTLASGNLTLENSVDWELFDVIVQATGVYLWFGSGYGTTDNWCGFDSITVEPLKRKPYLVGDNHMPIVDMFDEDGKRIFGFRPEDELINLLYTESEDLSLWTDVDAGDTVVAAAIACPDGRTVAGSIAADTTDGQHGFTLAKTLVATTYTFSAFVKPGDKNWVKLEDSTAASAWCYFNLSTGVVGTSGAGATGYIEPNWIDGWFRVWIVYTGTAASHTLKLLTAPADMDHDFAGDGATVNTYWWGMQCEAFDAATSPIVLASGANTRAADVLKYKGDDGNITNNQQGTSICETLVNEIDTVEDLRPTIYLTDGASSADMISAYFQVAKTCRFRSAASVGNAGLSIPTGDCIDGKLHKLTHRWAIDAMNGSYDDTAGNVDTDCGMPDDLDEIVIGSNQTATLQFNGIITKTRIYDRVLDYNSSRIASAKTTTVSPPWSLIMLPDTQNLVEDYEAVFEAQIDWIISQIEPQNIKAVLHMGDITDNNNAGEWTTAQYLKNVASSIPMIYGIGNHDLGSNASNRTSLFNSYFTWADFGPAAGRGGYYSTDYYNSYHYFVDGGGIEWMVLTLEFGPRDAVITWAEGIIEANLTRNIVIVTHAYLYHDDTRYDYSVYRQDQSHNPYIYGVAPAVNDGQEFWEKLVRKYNNIRIVLSGHVLGDGVGLLSSVGDTGNTVHQMLANYQGGNDDHLRILTFDNNQNLLGIKTYSPNLGTYLTDPSNQFSLTMNQGGVNLHGVGLIDRNATLNSTTVVAAARYKLGDADGTDLDEWVAGETLDLVSTPVPSYNQGPPAGSDWDAVTDSALFNGGGYYQADNNSFVSPGTDDIVVELIVEMSTTDALRVFSKRTGTGGQGFEVRELSDTLTLVIEDVSANTANANTGTLVDGTVYVIHWMVDRDEASANGFRCTVNGVAVGSADPSSVGDVDVSQPFTIGAHAGGGNNYDKKIFALNIWHDASWLAGGSGGKDEFEAWALARSNLFWGIKSHGVNSLAVNPLINGAIRLPSVRYKLGDANATNLVAWDYGATLVRQVVGVAPTYNDGPPTGDNENWDSDTDSCLFNASDYYQCADGTTGDIADEDFFWELVCYFENNSTERMIDKRVASNEGYSILKSTDSIRILIEDAPNNTVSVYSAAASTGWHHFCGYGNRNEPSTNGSIVYTDGVGGTGVDISGIGSLTNTEELTLGATVAGAGNYDKAISYFSMWKAASMIKAGAAGKAEIDALALARSNLFWGV